MTTSTNGTAEATTNEIHTNGIGTIRGTDINQQMQSAYLDYAMSVIVARALPDVRDGLKPVHRRILYSMYRDLGLTSDKPHKKSARIVGEVLGKYHPHGDVAVYESMVRMAQDFSLRYPLVDGQGNFGSIDGDSAAAMRYTEARLERISNLMLEDLEKNTVDWHDNFDSSLMEPDILPAALPNLLINGSSGIAVGMATNIPPHNLAEVVDALVFMIEHYEQADDITVDQLMQFIKGPDFPTGGILYRYREDKKGAEETDAIAQGYAVGKSRLVLQAKAHFEEMSRNRSRIVITELPYQTNKTALVERIANLVRDGKIEGITDLRDESDRTGMRVVIELTRNVAPKNILERLFKYTPLQQTFGMQMLALVEDEPRTLSLKRLLYLFLQHRQEIIRRRSEFDLAKAKERAHIVEGLLRALDILDEVIATIRRSQRVETARNNLIKNFQFTAVQAQAILDMQLRRLAALERKKLQDEYKELLKWIKYLEDLLAHPEKILEVIKQDLLDLRELYGDARRTQLVERTKGTLTSTDLLPDQQVWVAVSAKGDLRRHDVNTISPSRVRRVGKGSEVTLLTANTRDYLYLFSKEGQCRRVAIHEIPQNGSRKHLAELTDFSRRDDITAAVAIPRDIPDGVESYLFMVTEKGMTKRVTVADFLSAAHMDPVVMNVEPRDRLFRVFHTQGDQEVIFVSNTGQSIRFSETDVRSMGLAAGGVGGMKLKKEDVLVYAGIVDPQGELLTVSEKGFGKRTPLAQYSKQGRNGGGIVTFKSTTRTGKVATAAVLNGDGVDDTAQELLAILIDSGEVKPVNRADIPKMGRSVQGKQLAVDMGTTVIAARTIPIPSPEEPVPNGSATNGAEAVESEDKKAKSRKATAKTLASSATSARSTSKRVAKSRATQSTAKVPGKKRTTEKEAASNGKPSAVKISKSTTTRKSSANGKATTQAKASTRGTKNGVSKASTTARTKPTQSASSKPKSATSKAAVAKMNGSNAKGAKNSSSKAVVSNAISSKPTKTSAKRETTSNTRGKQAASNVSKSTTSKRGASAKSVQSKNGAKQTASKATTTRTATTKSVATSKPARSKNGTRQTTSQTKTTATRTRTQKSTTRSGTTLQDQPKKPAAKNSAAKTTVKRAAPAQTKTKKSRVDKKLAAVVSVRKPQTQKGRGTKK